MNRATVRPRSPLGAVAILLGECVYGDRVQLISEVSGFGPRAPVYRILMPHEAVVHNLITTDSLKVAVVNLGTLQARLLHVDNEVLKITDDQEPVINPKQR